MLLGAILLQASSVVVIIADDVAQSDLEVIPTPHIDALAASGMQFARAYSMPVCAATRESIFFGELATRHRRTSCSTSGSSATDPIAHPVSKISIADIASFVGLGTGMFGKWHLGLHSQGGWENAPGEQGFDTWYATQASTAACEGTGYDSWVYSKDGSPSSLDSGYNTEKIKQEALLWIASRQSAYFAWVSFNAGHTPFHDPPASSLPAGYTIVDSNRGRYEASVVAIDCAVGDLIASIDMKSTIVIFIGDNGTPRDALRPDQEAHKVKRSTFEDGINVPMIFAGPGIAQGATDELAHVTDIYTTVSKGLGLPALGEGVSLLPLVLGNSTTSGRDHTYSGHHRPGIHDRAVVTDQWKYRKDPPLGIFELYDLLADPSEDSPYHEGDPEWQNALPLIAIMEDIEGG